MTKTDFCPKQELEGFVPAVGGYQVAVKVYTRPEKIGSIMLPDMIREAEKSRSCVGRVVAMGPDAYKGDRFKSGPWCTIGDWVVFPKYEGNRVNFKNHTLQVFSDDRVMMIVENPDDIIQY